MGSTSCWCVGTEDADGPDSLYVRVLLVADVLEKFCGLKLAVSSVFTLMIAGILGRSFIGKKCPPPLHAEHYQSELLV